MTGAGPARWRPCARPVSDALRAGGGRDRGGDRRRDALVERGGDDLVRAELVGDDGGERLGGGELHALGDLRGAHLHGAREDAGEGQHVVDLVRVVAAAGGDHGRVLVRDVRVDLRGGVGHREDERVLRHLRHRRLRDRAAGDADEDIGPVQRVLQRSGQLRLVGEAGQLALDVGQVAAVGGDDALAVADRDIADAGLDEDLGDGDTGRTGAGDDRTQLTECTVGQLGGIAQRGEGDDGRAVLVVVEDRDVEALLELGLDLEAPRGGDVFQVDAAEGGRHPHDGVHDLVGVGGGERDRDRVHAAELLEEDGLALHHGEGGLRADVAQAQHRGAVRDDGHDLGLPGVVVHELGMLGDCAAHLGDARCVREGQVVLVADRHGRLDGHLAAAVERKGRIEEAFVRTARNAVRTGVRARAVAARIDDLRCHLFQPLYFFVHQLRVSTPWSRGGRAPRPVPARRMAAARGEVGRRARRTRALSPG